jgi:hypothetical protein
MYRSIRKTAPKVRNGHIQKKNRWETSEDADDKLFSPNGMTFETRSPGPGNRHVVSVKDIQRFVRCIPEWPFISEGLHAIVLGDDPHCLGRYDRRGIIYLFSWDKDLIWECDPNFFEEHSSTLLRLGVPSDFQQDDIVPLYFDEKTARAFQLVHVFLHELGHHHDRMTSLQTKGPAARRRHFSPRGETFAEEWAISMEQVVWQKYKEYFGVPGHVRFTKETAYTAELVTRIASEDEWSLIHSRPTSQPTQSSQLGKIADFWPGTLCKRRRCLLLPISWRLFSATHDAFNFDFRAPHLHRRSYFSHCLVCFVGTYTLGTNFFLPSTFFL